MYARLLGRFDRTRLRSLKGMALCTLRKAVYVGLRMLFRW